MYAASKRYCQKALSLDPKNRQINLWMVDAHVAAQAHKDLRALINKLIVEMQNEQDTKQDDIHFLLVTSYQARFKPEVLKLANMMPEDKQIRALKRWAHSK